LKDALTERADAFTNISLQSSQQRQPSSVQPLRT
jgi:hypothetical protein